MTLLSMMEGGGGWVSQPSERILVNFSERRDGCGEKLRWHRTGGQDRGDHGGQVSLGPHRPGPCLTFIPECRSNIETFFFKTTLMTHCI